MMQKTKLIVFDIDGTLTDTVQLYTDIYIESLKDIGVDHSYSNFSQFKHHTDSYIGKCIYEKLVGKVFTQDVLNEFEEKLTERCRKASIKEITGAREKVNQLEKESEYGVCFATGSLLKPAELKLETIGISYPPNLLVASNHIHERENIVSLAIENAKQYYRVDQFERIISVGDGVWDLKTAENLNIEFIGIGSENKTTLEKVGCKTHFRDFTTFRV